MLRSPTAGAALALQHPETPGLRSRSPRLFSRSAPDLSKILAEAEVDLVEAAPDDKPEADFEVEATTRYGDWTFYGGMTVIYPCGGALSNSTVKLGRAARRRPGLRDEGAVSVAVKVVALSCAEEDVAAIRREQNILKGIGEAHPHVLPMLHFEETPTELVMLTPFAPSGDLGSRVPRNACLAEAEVRKLTQQLLSALAFLHSHSIIHGDVKPENVFLTEVHGAMSAQLADFGLSRRLPQGDQFVTLEHVQGSHGFIPAEVIHRLELYPASDLFALGVIVFRYLGGYDPFYPVSRVTEPLMFDEAMWRPLSCASRDFVAQLLAVEPEARGDACSLLEEHAWMGAAAESLGAAPGCLNGLCFHTLESARACWRSGRAREAADLDAHPGSRIVA